MVILIRSLQMVSHFPLLQVLLQANAVGVFSVILELLMFDYLAAFINWKEQSVVSFNKDAQKTFEDETLSQMHDVGYGSYNSIQILNTVSIAIFIYMIQLIVYLLLVFSLWYTKKNHG